MLCPGSIVPLEPARAGPGRAFGYAVHACTAKARITVSLVYVAAAAARDLLAGEAPTKPKKKRNKRRANSPVLPSLQEAVTATNHSATHPAPPTQHLLHSIGATTACLQAEASEDQSALPFIETRSHDQVQDAELKLLEAMGWSDDLNVCSSYPCPLSSAPCPLSLIPAGEIRGY